ncbi:hypothetical protein [Natrialbaceae archaeon AArc-T1-2]|uniref:hypothetical protein n=1 Tax=Natrialbaceae archaeon AArc-T1-2 TaxID=3053904 RepID=UPI00255AB6DC|nr:hypothetical protein [Natrialbaceae archaeon AArc-T1-2]WIV67545.1 hypothetical protein QQ977_02100 [Natrialbaceae archaeon AArc-T1-2]
MEIHQTDVEQETTLHSGLPFVEMQDVAAGDHRTAAIEITGPEGYLVAIDAGTNIAPEFRDDTGEKLDGSTKVTLHKCSKQGDPLPGGQVFSDTLNRFKYEKMRVEPDYFRYIDDELMIAEREIVKLFVEIPEDAADFSAEQSRLHIGDDTSDFGTPVSILDTDNLTPEEKAAVDMAAQR